MTPPTDLVARLTALGAVDFPLLLHALHEARYTGAVTLHCHNGTPRLVEVHTSVKVSLDTPARPGAG